MNNNAFKITFVYPDFENLGVEYLMAICLKAGYRVELVYYQIENSYLGKKKTISYSKIAKKIRDTAPDFVAFSCVTDNYQYQLACAKALKKINHNIITIFGGIHPTAVPKRVLRQRAVDAIAIGEADISLLEFLKRCKKGKKPILPNARVGGIVFKKPNKLVGQFQEGPLVDLDKLPFPYKEPFFPSLRDLANEYRIITSRGCPYSCTYCFNSFTRKMRGAVIIRQRSVAKVIKELVWAKKKYKIKNVFFIDDSFTTNKKWIAKFAKIYKRKIGLPFACIANPDYIDRKVAQSLKMAGCVFVQIGIQSLDKTISKQVLNRSATKEKITQTIKYLKASGLMVQVDHMFGVPGDSLEKQEEALLYYNEYRPELISIFWLIYYPKTPIIDLALREGILKKKDVATLEEGKRLTRGSIHDGGSMKDPGPFYSIQLILNYLPFLPKWLVKFLIRSSLYKIFNIRNYYISTALPRAMLSLTDRRYFTGRNLLISFFNDIFKFNH